MKSLSALRCLLLACAIAHVGPALCSAQEEESETLKKIRRMLQGGAAGRPVRQGSIDRARVESQERVAVVASYRGLLFDAELAPILSAVKDRLAASLGPGRVTLESVPDHELALRALAARKAGDVIALVHTACFQDVKRCSLDVALVALNGQLGPAWPSHLHADVSNRGEITDFVAAAALLKEDNSAWFGAGSWTGTEPLHVRFPSAAGPWKSAPSAQVLEASLARAAGCRTPQGKLALRVLVEVDPRGKVTRSAAYLDEARNEADAAAATLDCVRAALAAVRFRPATGAAARRLGFILYLSRSH